MNIPVSVLFDSAVIDCDALQLLLKGQTIQLKLRSVQAASLCPVCQQPSHRIHSRYQRTLADLPWANHPVQLVIEVRRFFCDNDTCPRRIFAERLAAFATAWARRTLRLAEVQRHVSLIAGGRGGAQLCETIACPAGVDLLIHLVRCQPRTAPPTPRVLGVDDWAIRKGQTYGTLLVDHERGHVVEVLPDRTPETLTQWLKDHPGVQVVTRDRAEGYAQGIRAGAPEAQQVADRWHLLKNLTDALTKILQDHTREIRASPVNAENTCESSPMRTPAASTEHPGVLAQPSITPTASDRERQARAQQAHALSQAGWRQRDIARQLGCHPKTIRRYLQRALPLAPRGASRETKLDPYHEYLRRRWNEGCRNATQLFREIQPQGYGGGCTRVSEYIAKLRHIAGAPARVRRPLGRAVEPTALKAWPSARSLAWLATQPLDWLDSEQQQLVMQLRKANATVAKALDLAQSFASMVRGRQPDKFKPWLAETSRCGIKALQSLAKGLEADAEAVTLALGLNWSNGRTEGFVNRLKCLKRQTYGRAKLDLLRQRLLAA